MRKVMFLLTIGATALLLAAGEGWQITEEVTVNGSTVTKRSYFDDRIIKVVNEAGGGSTETIIDLAADKVTLINHFQKSYQISKLSDYLKFAEGIATGLKNGGYADPEKLEPKIVFTKKGTEKIGAWDTIRYLVSVDGKDIQEVWVAPALKNSPVIALRKTYAALLPESLVKYRALEEKIKDRAAGEGLVVKTVKLPLNKKLPKVEQTMTALAPVAITPALLAIPAGYLDKTIPAQGVAPTPKPQ